MRLYQLAASAALLPCVLHAQANPDSLENITVTATRVPTPVVNLPAGVTVIDRKTIEERGYVTLVDALSAVPGVRVVQSGGPGAQSSVFIRGTNSNHVLVLRDGVPINDPSDPGGAFNFGVDTLDDVERIEVVRGAMSSLYGSGAIGGVINLISRPGHGAPHGHVTLAAGSPRAGLAQADVAGGFGITDYAVSLEGFSTRGFDVTPQREVGVYTGEADGDRTKQAEISVGVTPFADTRFSMLLRARDAKSGYDAGGYPAYDGGNASAYDASLFGRLGLTTKLLAGAWDTSVYLSGLQNDRRNTVTLDAQDPNQSQQYNRYAARRLDGLWTNTVRLADYGGLSASSVTFGYEHQSDRVRSKADDLAFGAVSDIGRVRAHGDSDGGYVGAQSTLSQRLALTAQVREDATSLSGDAFTWRAGGVVSVPELWSHIKASYGTSFRAPALNDRYGQDNYGGGFGFAGNPNLRPERGKGYEAGVTTDLPQSIPGNASVSITYFHNRIRDLILAEPLAGGTVYSPVNINRARAEGIETTLTLRASTWLQADLTYTYTDARDLGTAQLLARRPYNQGSANLRISPFPGFVVAPELLYVGSSLDFLTDNAGFPSAEGLTPSGLIVNLNISWQVTQAMQVFVWGRNLGDSTFEPASGYQTPGTSAMAGVRIGF